MTKPPPDTLTLTASGPAVKVRLSSNARRLFAFIVPVNLAVYMILGAVPNVLLPLQVQGIDEANKAANLALIIGAGGAVAMIISPVAGLISDRTRSRFGRRSPWMVVGAITTGLTLAGMGFANGIVQLLIAWTIMQLAINLIISPMGALMPERVPSAVRGIFSTIAGIGAMVGILAGQIIGATLASNIRSAYLILPGLAIVVIALFVVFCADTSSRDMPRERLSLVLFLKTFWVSPRRYPDFFWGFVSRLTLTIGYFLITGYQLYILQDYIGLGDDAIGTIPLLGVVTMLAMVLAMSIAGPLSDKIGRRKPMVIAAAIILAGALLIPLAMPTLNGMILYTALSSFGVGSYMSVDAALMSEVLPGEESYAKDLGVLNIAATLPQTIGPLVAGIIVMAAGYSALFPVGMVLATIGALAVIPIKSVR